MYRRLLVVPMNKSFEGRERKYIKSDYLNRRDVLEYVLYHVLAETDYYELDEPKACRELLADFKGYNDAVRQFLEDVLPEASWDLLEDGVGMWRMYHDSFWDELQFPRSNVEPRSIDVVTGTLAAPLIREMAEATHAKYPQISVTVHAIQNDYFGGTVSVAGLVTGTDIIKQCKGNLSSNILCVPEVMLRDEKDRFLDDLTAKQLGEALGCEIEVIPTDGAGGCKAYLGELKPKPKRKKLHFSFGGR